VNIQGPKRLSQDVTILMNEFLGKRETQQQQQNQNYFQPAQMPRELKDLSNQQNIN
jgi:hypothetical protein